MTSPCLRHRRINLSFGGGRKVYCARLGRLRPDKPSPPFSSPADAAVPKGAPPSAEGGGGRGVESVPSPSSSPRRLRLRKSRGTKLELSRTDADRPDKSVGPKRNRSLDYVTWEGEEGTSSRSRGGNLLQLARSYQLTQARRSCRLATRRPASRRFSSCWRLYCRFLDYLIVNHRRCARYVRRHVDTCILRRATARRSRAVYTDVGHDKAD